MFPTPRELGLNMRELNDRKLYHSMVMSGTTNKTSNLYRIMTLNNNPLIDEELIKRQYEREEQMREQGRERFRRQLQQAERNRDLSRSKPGKVMDKFHLENFINLLKAFVKGSGRKTEQANVVRDVYRRVRHTPMYDLDTGEQLYTANGNPRYSNPWNLEQTALIVLHGMVDVCRMPIINMDDPTNKGKRGGARPKATTLEIQLGARLEQQIILNQLRKYFPDRPGRAGYVTRLLSQEIKDRASYSYKEHNTKLALRRSAEYFDQQGLGAIAERFRWKPWTSRERQQIGNQLMKLAVTALEIEPGIHYFEYKTVGVGQYADVYLALTEAGEQFFNAINLKAEETQLYHLPMICPPKPHTPEAAGGYLDIQMPQVENIVTGGFNGTLDLSSLHYEYLNNQQAQAFRINGWLADVMEQFDGAVRDGRNCGKFMPNPRKADWVTPMPEELRSLKKGQEGYSKKRTHRERIKKEYAEFMELERECKQTFTTEMMEVIRLCRNDAAIYLPTCSDFRGRSLVRTMLISYQGSDPHKAILEWAEGYEADDQTEFWLRMEMTGLMPGGLDKLAWEDRFNAIEPLRETIIACVRDPFGTKWWQSKQNVKKPWLWLAAAREWVRLYVDNDPNRITHLRTHIDATCSGQQYFAGLLRCRKTAEQVNLVKADAPADVYSNVLKPMRQDIESRKDTITPVDEMGKPRGSFDPERLTQLLEADDSQLRPGTKACIVAGQYGAGKETRIKGFCADNEVAPFSHNEGRAIYQSIEVGLDECLPAMDKTLGWIQKVTRDALETTGRNYILIPSADGSVVVQRYPKMQKRRIELEHLGCGSLPKRHQGVLQEPTKVTDRDNQIRSCAANLIHAQDGATLVLGLHDYDKPFACTHDSIAGRPGKEMWEIRDRMRKALYTVFTDDLLKRFVELNGLRWEDYQAPVVGDYDPAEVLEASYPYC